MLKLYVFIITIVVFCIVMTVYVWLQKRSSKSVRTLQSKTPKSYFEKYHKRSDMLQSDHDQQDH